jgi:uncharacterized protein (TIGR02594 family)
MMENAPRLARALADGLNVPISALRKMAEQGELTADRVVNAILSQSDVITREYARMPQTISGALTQIENAWTRYIGETDQANGTSRQFAETLSLIAKNFDQIVGPLASTVSWIAKVEVGGWLEFQEIIDNILDTLRAMIGLQGPGSPIDAETRRLLAMGRGQLSIEEIAGPPRGAQPQTPYFDGARRGGGAMGVAEQFLGMTERGNAENLTRFLNEHSGTVFNNLTVPWCARFVNASLQKAGLTGTNSAAARSFENYGKGIWQRGMSKDALADVQPGDIAVFTRKGGGHVGFVKAIDPSKGLLEILGGNQSNSVSVAQRSMKDLLAVRRAPGPGDKGQYENFDEFNKRAKKDREDSLREAERRQRDAVQRYIANLDDQAKAAQRQAETTISGIDKQINALGLERDVWEKNQQDKLAAAKGSYDAMAQLEAERAAKMQEFAGRELALIQKQYDARQQALQAAAAAMQKQLANPNLTDDEERRAKQGIADVQTDLVKLANDRAEAEAKAGQAAREAAAGGLELQQKQRDFIAGINADLEFQKQLYQQLSAAKAAGASSEGLAILRGTAEQTRQLPGVVTATEIGRLENAIAQTKIYDQAIADLAQTEQDRVQDVREQQLRENAYWDQLINRMEQYAATWREITGSQNDAFSRLAIQTNQYAKNLDQIGNAYDDLNKRQGDPAGVLAIAEGAAQGQAALNLMAQTLLALRSQYEEGTKGYEDMTAAAERMMEVQRALQLVEAVLGVVHQATSGDVYTAIPRMIGVAAMMASMGLNTGIGGGSNASMQYSASAGQADSGVFGDPNGNSDSILNALEIIRNNSSNDLNYSAAMLRALENIEAAMGGVTNTVIRGVAPASVRTGRMSGLGDLDVGGIDPLGQLIGNLIFSTYRKIADFGIQASQQTLSEILSKGFSGQIYTDIETTTKVLGMTVSKSMKTVFEGLDPAIAKQFSLAFGAIADAVREGGKAFGLTAEDFTQRMRGFIIDMGKISTKDMTGEELQTKITQMFSEQSDKIARRFMPGLGKYQQVGEGYFETFVRVAEGINRAGGELERLGVKAISYRNIERKQADIAAEIVRQSILAQGNLNEGMRTYIDELTGSAEEIVDAYKKLSEATRALRTAGLTESGLSRAMVNAAGGLDAFLSGMEDFNSNFLTDSERLVGSWRNMADEFTKLNLKMPTTNAEFRALVGGIDTSTEAGQKLFGKVISLSGAFANLSEAMTASRETLQAAYDTAKQQAQSLRDYLQSLKTGDMATGTPLERYQAAKSLYESTLARAQGGDQAAIDALQGVSSSFLELSKKYFAASGQYGADLASVQTGLGGLADAIDQQVKAAETQQAWLKANTEALTGLAAALNAYEKTMATINGIQSSQTGLGVGDAARRAAREAEAQAYESRLAEMVRDLRYAREHGQGKKADEIKAAIDAYIAAINADPDGYNAVWTKNGFDVQLLAKGGMAAPGWAIVGERGPEIINFNRPARVYTANETKAAMSAAPELLDRIENATAAGIKVDQAGYQALLAELRAIRAEMAEQTRNTKLQKAAA